MIVGMDILFAIMFFLPADSIRYWQAWMYIIILNVCMLAVTIYLLRNDPGLLERRMQYRERNPQQKLFVAFSYPIFIAVFLLPGFDQRFGWSHMAPVISIVAAVVVLLAYGFIFLVFRVNSYTARVIKVEVGQKVITSGPYALVRHPMYLGSIIMYIATPLALGSLVAVIPALLYIPVLVLRIRDEEETLARELEGYREYMQKTKYHMFPGIW
jgi:protein-S-isoprenylcysteine O-methyltransferase Ste14